MLQGPLGIPGPHFESHRVIVETLLNKYLLHGLFLDKGKLNKVFTLSVILLRKRDHLDHLLQNKQLTMKTLFRDLFHSNPRPNKSTELSTCCVAPYLVMLHSRPLWCIVGRRIKSLSPSVWTAELSGVQLGMMKQHNRHSWVEVRASHASSITTQTYLTWSFQF